MTKLKHYIVAGCKSWNRDTFDQVISKFPGKWHFLGKKEELTFATVKKVNPRYIFFLHWSWWVPKEIVEKYECICFHMTDVPYGRGGSPLQNLILRGKYTTKQTALKMINKFDAGPVYLKKKLSLRGSAEEIYIRASDLSAQMIKLIFSKEPTPVAQKGKVTLFRRRQPYESEIPNFSSLYQIYDFIRMLDAEGYPAAFIINHGLKYEFRNANLKRGKIFADVLISHQIKEIK